MPRIVDQIKAASPAGLRDGVRASARVAGRITSPWRPLPEFLVIGTKRGGTTTLFRALQDHPLVLPMFPAAQDLKSPHYFDLAHHRGEAWYRGHFPSRRARRPTRSGTPITGESSPYYLFHPLAPVRVHTQMPHVRLVVLLRDPAQRAFSHYWDRVKHGDEPRSFDDALDREEARLVGEEDRLRLDPRATSPAYEHHSYLARGRYADQLERWFDWFPREQVLVLRSEDLYADPPGTYRRTLEFLGLPDHDRRGAYGKLHGHPDRPELSPAQGARLREHFAPHNRRLADLLGTDVWWPE